MKSYRKQQRNINSISSSRWSAYAAAAVASSFAAAHSAEATIHYSGPLHTPLKGDDSAVFPLDPAGGSLVLYHRNFVYGSYSSILGGSAFAFVYAAVSGSANGFKLSCLDDFDSASVSNLNRGDSIAARPFVPEGGILAERSLTFGCGGPFRGQFLDRQRGALVGFKFNNGAGVQYGWARLKMSGFPDYNVVLVDYAYGDPGDTIVAGQTSDSAAPDLESLGGLALGGAGLLAWRGRRSR
jgi:hypothetical protein